MHDPIKIRIKLMIIQQAHARKYIYPSVEKPLMYIKNQTK